jgi:predicted metalloprotease with PDZ domain
MTAPPKNLPTLVNEQVIASTTVESKHGLRIKQGNEGAIVIYHIDPDSPAFSDTELEEGCEILTINDHRVRSTRRCVEMLTYYSEKNGMVDIVASIGDRPRGSSYLLAKSPSSRDIFDGSGSTIDGLELEEKGGGVRVVSAPKSGYFSTLHINKGDCIWSIDGATITSVDDMRGALVEGTGAIIHILTYNSFRKLKTTVMSDTSCALKDGDKELGTKGKQVKIEDMYNIHEKVKGICSWNEEHSKPASILTHLSFLLQIYSARRRCICSGEESNSQSIRQDLCHQDSQ